MIGRRRREPRVPRAQRTAFHRGGEGEPLVLIHGFTDTWTTWEPILSELECHHEVFAPTLVGHLGGAKVPDGAVVTDAMWADALERQLDEAGLERAHLVGNSLGGWLALVLATRGRALSAVALCPGGGWYPDSPEDRAIQRYFQRSARLMRTGDWWVDVVAARPRLRAAALRDVMAASTRLSATQARALFEGSAGCEVLHETLAHADRVNLFGDVGPIDVPVRIMYGTRDRLIRWPSYYTRLREQLPDAEYVPLEGLSHMPQWDAPADVVRRILEVTAPDAVPVVA